MRLSFPRFSQPTTDRGQPFAVEWYQWLRDVYDRIAGRNKQHMDGRFVEVAAQLETGQENVVAHGLGRAYVGWWLVDIDADANVWRDDASAEDETVYLVLRTDVTVSVNLVVF
jgi:hypothetical protein